MRASSPLSSEIQQHNQSGVAKKSNSNKTFQPVNQKMGGHGNQMMSSQGNQRGFSPNKAMWKASVSNTMPVAQNQFSIPASGGHSGNQGYRGMTVGGIQGSTYPRTKIS